MQTSWTLRVSQLNEYVRVQLAGDPILRDLRVQGEISGLKRVTSGHIYFTLKDESARIQCAFFRQYAAKLAFPLREGMQVVVCGSVSLYVRDGAYQITVESIETDGEGDLFRRFCMLKERLAKEGLFDPALKRPIPQYPSCVGIVTSETGAVLHDILQVGWKRSANMRFLLAPCHVQGEHAAEEIVQAIQRLNAHGGCDVILCGRGGGSFEDLWPFNEEAVARAIRASRIPVISCVGHETDFTIADFAADFRAATPSNAAEIAIPDQEAVLSAVRDYAYRLEEGMARYFVLSRQKLEPLSRFFLSKDYAQTLLQPKFAQLQGLVPRLETAMQLTLSRLHAQVDLESAKLSALHPSAPLQRGYALVTLGGKVTASADMPSGTEVEIWLKDGGVTAVTGHRVEGSLFSNDQS